MRKLIEKQQNSLVTCDKLLTIIQFTKFRY